MHVLALVSGGKDSIYSLCTAFQWGHKIVALGNLCPPPPLPSSPRPSPTSPPSAGTPITSADELNSHTFQTIGHELLPLIASALGIPLYVQPLVRGSVSTSLHYEDINEEDEVEDMFLLVQRVLSAHPSIDAICCGALLSHYQRLRVEHICSRLGLVSLAPLWERDQGQILEELVTKQYKVILIKIACGGLVPSRHLGREMGEIKEELMEMGKGEQGINVCGEGGEYESLVLDCPFFSHAIHIEEQVLLGDLNTTIAPVAYLKALKYELIEKKEGKSLWDMQEVRERTGENQHDQGEIFVPSPCSSPFVPSFSLDNIPLGSIRIVGKVAFVCSNNSKYLFLSPAMRSLVLSPSFVYRQLLFI